MRRNARSICFIGERKVNLIVNPDFLGQLRLGAFIPLQRQAQCPGDVIANYLSQMAAILEANQDTPAALIEKFDAFIKENEKSMRTASKKFDEKLKSLKSTDAEVYRETVQRKITPELNRVVSLLIDFGSKYPPEAAKLDSMLKVDAKYTYQQ